MLSTSNSSAEAAERSLCYSDIAGRIKAVPAPPSRPPPPPPAVPTQSSMGTEAMSLHAYHQGRANRHLQRPKQACCWQNLKSSLKLQTAPINSRVEDWQVVHPSCLGVRCKGPWVVECRLCQPIRQAKECESVNPCMCGSK